MRHLALFCLLLAGPVAAQPTDDNPGEAIARIESGVVCPPETVGKRPAPGTIAGYTNVIEEEPPFVSTVNRVPAVLGIGFGVKAMSLTTDGLSPVTMTVTHPPMGERGTTVQTFETRISGVDPSLTFYQFDYGYELLPGTWTMQASIGDEVLYVAKFDVLPPQLVPELATACGFEDLLS